MNEPRVQRVRITSPRTSAQRPRAISGAEEIDAQTEVGEVYMRSLIRSQLRTSITVLLMLGIGIGGLPLLFWAVPESAEVAFLGVPIAWLVLGFVVYPAMIAVGWWYVRHAERNERAFTELIERQ